MRFILQTQANCTLIEIKVFARPMFERVPMKIFIVGQCVEQIIQRSVEMVLKNPLEVLGEQ